jgi:hypothetical protein
MPSQYDLTTSINSPWTDKHSHPYWYGNMDDFVGNIQHLHDMPLLFLEKID